jgi:hypothetical protein
MEALPEDLLARLRERAGSVTRNDADHGVPFGTYDDWFDAVAVMEAAAPGSATAFALGAENARADGWPMQPVHVFRHADGSLSASTTSAPDAAPAAAGPEAWGPVEAATGQRVPAGVARRLGRPTAQPRTHTTSVMSGTAPTVVTRIVSRASVGERS